MIQRNDLAKRDKITWLVTVYTKKENREVYTGALTDANIDVREFFVPLSEMEIYRSYVFSNKVSREISKKGFNLPTSYIINEEEVNRVVNALKAADKTIDE